jgi:hypothetical protein
MDEVSLANRALLVHRGKRLAEGFPAEIARRFHGSLFRLTREPTVDLLKRASTIEGVSARRFGSSVHFYAPPGYPAGRLKDELERAGVSSDIEPLQPELEDVFVQMMES